jgi:phage nucleotide-binding protein
MAINIRSTGGLHGNGVRLVVYGPAGSGKTTLIKTLPNPIILSAESGLLSIQDANLPYIEINSMEDLQEAFLWASQSEEAVQFDSVALDSISEIGEVVLNHEKKIAKDPRQAYGALSEQMMDIIRSFRDLPNKNVYFSAKLEKSADEMGKVSYNPSMPGKSLTQALPYMLDEVLALRLERDADGNVQRALQCRDDGSWLAKDRSEAPDLGAIIRKIGGQ